MEAPQWDLVIKPRKGWFDLHLQDLWRYRDLVYLFVRRDFVSQFKQTILGPIWFVLQPLITTLMYVVVFGNIAKLSTDGLPQILFYMSGTILWQYFSQCLQVTADTFSANAGIFGKVYFPRLAVPISVTLGHIMKLGLQFLFFMCFWLYYYFFEDVGISMNALIFMFPVCILLMAMLGLGSGIIISSLTTKYRDLRFILQFGIQLLMYTTVVIYPLSSIAEGKLKWLILANPMTSIIETFRYGFLGTAEFSWYYLAYSGTFASLMLVLGILIFTKIERTFMDTV